MKKHIFLTFIASVMLLFSTSARAALKIQTHTVSGEDQKTCAAYLRIPNIDKKLPLVVFFNGTGLYSTGTKDSLDEILETILNEKKAMVLSIDKPGVMADTKLENGYTVDNQLFEQHTQRDLVTCGLNAIKWVENSNTNFTHQIFLKGHSEGAQVASRILLKSLQTEPKLASQIKILALSGLPMADWQTIIREQSTPSEWRQFKVSFNNRNNVELRKHGEVPYAYLNDIFKTPTLTKTFEELQKLKPQTKFFIYQGLEDKNVSCDDVNNFEINNKKNSINHLPALNWQARYYLAGHGLNLAAANDMIFAFLAFL